MEICNFHNALCACMFVDNVVGGVAMQKTLDGGANKDKNGLFVQLI